MGGRHSSSTATADNEPSADPYTINAMATTTKRFEGCVAIVTGASTGMGKAAALRLAQEGASVVIAARRKEVLDAAAADISAATGATVLPVVTDVSKEQDNKALVEAAVAKFGKVDAAFLNAGTSVLSLSLLRTA